MCVRKRDTETKRVGLPPSAVPCPLSKSITLTSYNFNGHCGRVIQNKRPSADLVLGNASRPIRFKNKHYCNWYNKRLYYGLNISVFYVCNSCLISCHVGLPIKTLSQVDKEES